MQTIHLDKIASVTKNANLTYDVQVTANIDCQEGAILAVEVLQDKKIYNKLELTSGRLSTLHKGDILAVALGNRRALKGFIGDVPTSLQVGDTIHMLNMGGVAGTCTSENVQEVGHAFGLKVLGAITDGTAPLNVQDFRLFDLSNSLSTQPKLIIVSGTCMNVGKTSVASEIIKHASRAGHTVFGAKLAGIAAMRDTENMKDYGAKKVASITDAGCTSTVALNGRAVEVAKGTIDYLASDNPDYIVIEFGDGLYGEYGVKGVLSDSEIQQCIAAHIGCAHDPVGAAKLVEICQEIGAPLNVISGPVTDNSVGVRFVKDHIQLPAFNALTDNEALFTHLCTTCLQ